MSCGAVEADVVLRRPLPAPELIQLGPIEPALRPFVGPNTPPEAPELIRRRVENGRSLVINTEKKIKSNSHEPE